MKTKQEIGTRIRTIRQRLKMNQGQLAAQLNVTNKAVSAYERGDAFPSLPCLMKIVQLGSVSFDWLVLGVELSADTAQEEARLVKAFRQAGREDQQALLKMADNAALVASLMGKNDVVGKM